MQIQDRRYRRSEISKFKKERIQDSTKPSAARTPRSIPKSGDHQAGSMESMPVRTVQNKSRPSPNEVQAKSRRGGQRGKTKPSEATGMNHFMVDGIRLERQERSHGDHRPLLQSFTTILTRFSRKLLPMERRSISPIRDPGGTDPSDSGQVISSQQHRRKLETKATANKRSCIRCLLRFLGQTLKAKPSEAIEVKVIRLSNIG